jgi:acyl carrier protein
MDREEILKKVNDTFIDVLDNDDIVLNYNTTAMDVDEWDSLNHIHLVVGLERKFKVKFTSGEIQSWNNIGELVDSIKTKLG